MVDSEKSIFRDWNNSYIVMKYLVNIMPWNIQEVKHILNEITALAKEFLEESY